MQLGGVDVGDLCSQQERHRIEACLIRGSASYRMSCRKELARPNSDVSVDESTARDNKEYIRAYHYIPSSIRVDYIDTMYPNQGQPLSLRERGYWVSYK